MGKNWSNVFRIMGVATLALSMVACSSGKKTVTADDFVINSNKIESKDGSYNITLEFYEKSPGVNYIIYENNKEIKSDRKDEKGKENKELIFTDRADGEYIYKVSVEDDNKETVDKEVKVKVEKNKDTEVKDKVENKNVDDKKVGQTSNEVIWNKESVEYKLKDKVSYEGKTYECLQGHTSQEKWTPLDASSLWKIAS